MSLLSNNDIFGKNEVKAGDWAFTDDERYIIIVLLKQEDGVCVLPITNNDPRHWTWNGDKEKPSLTPSILHHCKPTPWHGYLTDGKLVTA